jgi:RNA polymerase sigma factor (sigma-70 family)
MMQNRFKRKANKNVLSLDTSTKSENITFKDLIDSNFNIEKEIIKNENKKVLYNNISKLNTREQFIILNYYGILEKSLNVFELSQYLGVSNDRVYQIKKTALRKLKKLLESTKGWSYEK